MIDRDMDIILEDLEEINVKLEHFKENLEKNKVLVEYNQNQVYFLR